MDFIKKKNMIGDLIWSACPTLRRRGTKTAWLWVMCVLVDLDQINASTSWDADKTSDMASFDKVFV